MTDTYEGWANRETWLVNLWLTNDEGTYYMAREIARGEPPQVSPGYDPVEHMREFVEGIVLGDEPPANLTTDLLIGSLSRVEYREIVEGLQED